MDVTLQIGEPQPSRSSSGPQQPRSSRNSPELVWPARGGSTTPSELYRILSHSAHALAEEKAALRARLSDTEEKLQTASGVVRGDVAPAWVVSQLESALGRSESQAVALRTTVESLRAELAQLGADAQRLYADAEALRAHNASLQAENASVHANTEALRAEAAMLREGTEAFRTEFVELRAAAQAEHDANKELREQRASLGSAREALRAENDALRAELASVRDEKVRLASENERLHAAAAALQLAGESVARPPAEDVSLPPARRDDEGRASVAAPPSSIRLRVAWEPRVRVAMEARVRLTGPGTLPK